MCLCITSRFLQRCGPLQQSGWHAEWRRAKRILGRIRRRRRRWRGGAGGVTCNTDDACSCSSAGSQVNRRCILIRSADRQRRCCPFIKARNTCIHESPPKIIESLLSMCFFPNKTNTHCSGCLSAEWHRIQHRKCDPRSSG